MRLSLSLISTGLLFLFLPTALYAAEAGSYTVLARVTSVISTEQVALPGIGTPVTKQVLTATLLDGAAAGSLVRVSNDYAPLAVGQKFYALHTVDHLEGVDAYTVLEPYRLDGLLYLGLIFLFILVCFGGWQGLRGLIALLLSLGSVVYLLLPGVMAGYSASLVSVGVAAFVIVVGSYITHGIRRSTTAAVIGMLVVIILVGVGAQLAVSALALTGFSSDEAVYLNLGSGSHINFAGLLLGGMLIGLLGVLYDAAIGQAVTVEELCAVAPSATRVEVYQRALRIGREHIGALVNTLAIAYVGVALPLLLFFYSVADLTTLWATVNREIFSAELVRMCIGGIGVVLAVPITTAVAIWLMHGRKKGLVEPQNAHTHHHHSRDAIL